MPDTLQRLIPQLANRRVLVVGDVVLDEYLTGNAARMSREAPVPVLEFTGRRLIPGGAANPAATIVALGSTAALAGLTGDDVEAEQLRQVLAAQGIDTGGVLCDSSRPTTVKTRIMAQMGLRFPQQVARLDRLSREPVTQAVEQRMVEAIMHRLPEVDAVLFSDYHNGLLTPSLVGAVIAMTGDKLVAADAQGELAKYAGCTLVKCNADEARAYLRRELATPDDFAAAAQDLCRTLRLSGGMLITRGAQGVTLAAVSGEVYHIPAPRVADVYDTVGAGDTTIAVLTLGVLAGGTLQQAAALANYASGLVVRRMGNYAPSPGELAGAVAEEQ